MIRPFQPTVVRGFSKNARITSSISSLTCSASSLRTLRIVAAGGDVVDGAGTGDHEQAVIDPVHDGADLVPAPRHDPGQAGVQRQFRDHVLRGRQRGELADAQVGCWTAGIRGLLAMLMGVSCSGGAERALIRTRREMAKGRE